LGVTAISTTPGLTSALALAQISALAPVSITAFVTIFALTSTGRDVSGGKQHSRHQQPAGNALHLIE